MERVQYQTMRWHGDPLVWAGSDRTGTFADDSAFLPVLIVSRALSNPHTASVLLTSAKAFHLFFSSSGSLFHCSPMILEMSGLAKPGLRATMAAWWFCR